MGKTKLPGIKICACIFLIMSLHVIASSVSTVVALHSMENTAREIQRIDPTHPNPSNEGVLDYTFLFFYAWLGIGLVLFIIAIGLFRLKRWALRGVMFWGFSYLLFVVFYLKPDINRHCGSEIVYFLYLALSMITLIYFIRPKVKEQFK
jgi:hypothetical protein